MREKEDSLTLEILQAIEKKENVTQRHLAQDLGVALGLANSYLKRCARKGFIKIQQAPPNRYLYYLTPKGFAEKSRLSAQYLSSSFDFYRRASSSYSEIFAQCQADETPRLLLCGLSEMTEIAYIRAQEFKVELIGIWDADSGLDCHLGLQVFPRLDNAAECDAFIITALNNPTTVYESLQRTNPAQAIFAPEMLGLTQQQPVVMDNV